MGSVELILAIKEYAKRQGVDFEIALKMLGMMHEDGVHLDGGYDGNESVETPDSYDWVVING